jgi:hypothetical protein
VNYASERLDQGCYRRIECSNDLYSIHRRNSNELGQSAGQSRDAVLAIELALMTVPGAAIVTQNLAPPTHAIQALVDYHTIAFTQICHRATNLRNNTCDLMTEYLRLQRKWNLLTVFVRVVVSVTGEDVNISSAKTDRRNANQHFVRRDYRTRNVAHFETIHIAQDTRLHRLVRGQL